MNSPTAAGSRAIGSTRARWLILFSFLAVLAILDCFHDYFAHRGGGSPIGPLDEIKGGILFWGTCLLLVPFVIALANRFPLTLKQPRSVVLHALCALLFTYLNVMIHALARWPTDAHLDYWGRVFYLLQFEFALDYAFYGIIVVALYLLRQYEDLKEREVRESQLEVALSETRLRAIEAQLNPHFFFNTLQAIAVLAMDGQREAVVSALGRLSNLLRVSFDKHRPQQVSLAAEMEFLEGYLSIHQLCFEQRLTIQTRISTVALNAQVPTMLLQPLVENAIVHGIAITPGNGLIRIVGERSGGDLILEVADSGPGFQTSPPYRIGVGLSATESRLKVHFGDHHSIDYSRCDLGGASVRIRIPFVAARASGLAPIRQSNSISARP
jgi:two-component sensor histidine kinase